ncbi:uncharacterized protein LOC130636556 isoform X1 [Hydractinia symbiolongicarpus]|uniref:uncharacterized protein LOC130636556 isoform X1 n=1 Tax=Hydractinia symbiolongicarpus TaxID=13093 RepID=UPI00254F3E2D|nr:uncharacterized protein LOC130636556 isoform X1 [Hydractinia symbiolongicarpus]
MDNLQTSPPPCDLGAEVVVQSTTSLTVSVNAENTSNMISLENEQNTILNHESAEQSNIEDETMDMTSKQSDEYINNALNCLKKCQDGIALEIDFTQKMRNGYFKSFCSMLAAEDTLLSLATDDDVDGIFLCSIVHADAEQTMARYFEFGAFSGFYLNVMGSMIKERYAWNVFPYNIYTEKDVIVEKQRACGLYASRRIEKPKKEYKNFSRKIYKRTSTGIAQCMSNLLQEKSEGKVDCDLVVCMVLQKRQNWEDKLDSCGHSKQRYFISTDSITDWESQLKLYRSNPQEAFAIPNFNLFTSTDDRVLSLEEQLMFLSSIPNFHKWIWYGKNNNAIKFEQRFSISSRWFPGSPRSRIIQAMYNGQDNVVIACLKTILGEKVCFDYKTKTRCQSTGIKRPNSDSALCEALGYSAEEEMGGEIVELPCKAMAKETQSEGRTVTVNSFEDDTDTQISDCDDDSQLDVPTHLPSQDLNNKILSESSSEKEIAFGTVVQTKPSLYSYFCGELFRQGTIAWRVLTQTESTVTMNAYHCESGDFLPTVFVHTSVKVIAQECTFSCTCLTFSTNLSPNENATTSTCCHCRLLKELHVDEVSTSFVNMSKVKEAKQLHQVKVLKLPSKDGTDKFSVAVDGVQTEFVTLFHVSRTGKTIVRCHSSRCQREQGSCRDIKRLSSNAALCPHLSAFRSFYTQQVRLSCEELDVNSEEEDNLHEDVEEDYTLMEADWGKVFDVDTGLWNFAPSSPSQETVDVNRYSEKYIYDVRKRWSTGLTELVFVPDIGSNKCDCEAGWTSSENENGVVVFSHYSNLFTDRGVRKCKIYRRTCLLNNCSKRWDGASDSIFQLSHATCAGYELGWQFVDSVVNSKMTFSGFVSCCQEKCKILDSYFMNVNTFINWFFGWASRMRIDFRQLCPGCDGPSPFLACDGTKIGLTFKNLCVEPIEKATKEAPTNVKKSRLDRCFLRSEEKSPSSKKQFAAARLFLRNLCCDVLSGKLDCLQKYDQLQSLLTYIPNSCVPSFVTMVQAKISIGLRQAYAAVFKLLSYDSCIDALIPLKICDEFMAFLELCELNSSTDELKISFIHKMRHYNCEIATLLSVTEPGTDVIQLFFYCCTLVKKVHEDNIDAVAAAPLENTYNPPRFGRAYYFTEHGKQLREVRSFPVDTKDQQNFDDTPDEICQKRFPQVSKKGTSYLFLWFCPKHGHCLGFHIIPGSEGRKDPAASLYAYCEHPPEVVLYDFTCSLSEYVHNRESGYFKDTRFFHDVFHGYTHSCSSAFRYNGLLGFEAVNSSICEQFNSFMQKIKTSAKLMSQTHFTFYLQFFIYIWNKKKEFLSLRRKILH